MRARLLHGWVMGAAVALAAAPGAAASITVGADLSRTPNQYAGCSGGSSVTCAIVIADSHDTSGNAHAVSVPFDGVIVRARARPGAGATGSARLRIVRRGATPPGTDFTFVASTGSIAAPGTNDVVTAPERIPVKQGDMLAFDGSPGSVVGSYLVPFAGDPSALYFEPSPADGATVTSSSTIFGTDFLFNVDVEPDVDHDGYGDETQDQCPEDAALQGPCQADFEAKLVAPVTVPVGALIDYTVQVRNVGPDSAHGTLTVTDSLPTGLTPIGASSAAPGNCQINGSVVTCQLTASAFPKAAALPLGVNITAKPAGPGEYTNTVQITSDNDPNSANDGGSAVTTVAYAPGRCKNPQSGTNIPDVMNGTPAGDLLHGFLGGDVIKGFAGDDCLFGDIGDDMIDGGPGNDFLSGGRGNDRENGGPGDDSVSGDGGRDTLTGGPGRDTLNGGTGNDTLKSRDRTRDTDNCGPGKDKVLADKKDKLIGCEVVKRR